MPKFKSMQLDLWFPLSSAGGVNQIQYIDISQSLSLVNRVALRQGLQIAVKGIELVSAGTTQVVISKFTNDWCTLNAWEMAFHNWNEQQKSSAEEAGKESVVAKYRDFKIFFNEAHATAGVSANLIPANFLLTGGGSTVYDWDASEFVLPNQPSGTSVEVFGHMYGADDAATPGASSTCGLIQAYAENRARPQSVDPNIVDMAADETLFGAMIDVGEDTDDIIANWTHHNNIPPYLIDQHTPFEFYPGGSSGQGGGNTEATSGIIHAVLSTTAGTERTVGGAFARGGLFNCGLIKVHSLITTPPPEGYTNMLRVTVEAGELKGIMARPMQEAN